MYFELISFFTGSIPLSVTNGSTGQNSFKTDDVSKQAELESKPADGEVMSTGEMFSKMNKFLVFNCINVI